MKRLWVAVGWTAVFEAGWAAVLIAIGEFAISKIWLAENFLKPELLRQEQSVMEYAGQLEFGVISAAVVIFVISLICGLGWHLWGAFSRIDGPGQAAQRRWLGWFFPLAVGGALLSLAAVYTWVQTIDLVADQALIELYIVGFILFAITYYIGTFFPTAPKLRPAVPWARVMPALPGY
jgi:hypothetical protein